VDWDLALLVSSMAAELAIIILMIRSRAFRSFPVFSFYICWSLFSDGFLYYVQVHYPVRFFHIYLKQLMVDSAMIFALLVEVAWSVLRPIRNSLPKYSWIGIAVLVAVGGLILWPVAGFAAPPNLPHIGKELFLLQQTPALLRAVFFLALVGFSQVLSIGWRDRELQIATGLGFYSIVSLSVFVLHTHQVSGTRPYHVLDQVASLSYVLALFYWVYAFARQPAERREFSPQMQSMLLAVAGAARSTRLDLSGPGNDKSRQ
jgi:hypothetical protein